MQYKYILIVNLSMRSSWLADSRVTLVSIHERLRPILCRFDWAELIRNLLQLDGSNNLFFFHSNYCPIVSTGEAKQKGFTWRISAQQKDHRLIFSQSGVSLVNKRFIIERAKL